MIQKLLYALCTALLLCVGVALPQNTFASDETYVVEQSQFKVWKTIKLGTGLKTWEDFRTALTNAGYCYPLWTEDMIKQPAFTVATKETTVDLVVVSVAELGFKNRATRKSIYARAQELGLELAPAEVGLQLRLQYPDQPMYELLIIGMKPIIAPSNGGLRAFYVYRDYEGRCIIAGSAGRYDNDWDGRPPAGDWGVRTRFVFVSRK